MKNLKVKIIVGFRRDQEHSIPAEEAHKAYYLFLNPEARSVFSNGLAIKGSQIEEIVPDYVGSMDWNAAHVIDSDDWNEIRASGIDVKLRMLINTAKEVAQVGDLKDLNVPLTELVRSKYTEIATSNIRREGEVKSLKELMQ